jgi:hypothetical protein
MDRREEETYREQGRLEILIYRRRQIVVKMILYYLEKKKKSIEGKNYICTN